MKISLRLHPLDDSKHDKIMGKISMQQQRKNLISFYKKIWFCNSTNNLKQKQSSASFFNCFSKLMVTGVFWWVLNILHFAHYFYLYWIGVISFFVIIQKSEYCILYQMFYLFKAFQNCTLQGQGAKHFFEFIRNFEKSEMSKIVACE